MATLPKFTSIEEESEFWDTHDAGDYLEDTVEVDVHFVDARRDVPITIRLPREARAQLQAAADQQGVDARTLLHTWAMERLANLPAATAPVLREPQGTYHGETR